MTSLDHAMWFHAPFKADEWMLCVACGVIAARCCSRLLAALPDASSAVFVAFRTLNFLCISFVMSCCSYVMDSPALSNQRGINMGRVYTQVTSWWGWGIGCGVEGLV